jgi:hypothetical protein
MSDSLLAVYAHCSVCESPLADALAQFARRQFERKVCGAPACRSADDVRTGRVCCDRAEPVACVCVRSYRCPTHGETHIGSHD